MGNIDHWLCGCSRCWRHYLHAQPQILQTEQLAADQRKRRARAARAMLPLALSELAGHATACIQGLYNLRPYFQSNGSLDRSQTGNRPSTWTVPRLPENVLSLLKECIEFSDDSPAEMMTKLIRHFQVQNSRLTEDMSRFRLNDGVRLLVWANIQLAIGDAAELYARAGALYPFARGDALKVLDISRANIYNALFVAGCCDTLEEIDALANEWQRGKLIPHPS
jgi:hypothetical protein